MKLQNGISVFGTAKAYRIEDEDITQKLADMLSNAASLVSFGIPVPKGLLQNPLRRNQNYWRIASLNYHRLDLISSQAALVLESEGHTATPVLS